jgi:putative ABC transport system ATP-binding protein
MIRMRRLSKVVASKAGKVWILRDVTLDVQSGEFLTIMGPSGAGKSTLLAIIGMLDGEFEGEYAFRGDPVRGISPKQRVTLHREHIGFVFQQYHLIDDLTVWENLELPLSYRDIPRRERQAMVADTLDRFQMVAKKDLFPSQLSGGQQQLVGVARAVIGRPKVILADEPTGNLHTRQGDEIMELFCRLNAEGTTIIQVTHSERNASCSRRVVQLLDGGVVGDELVSQRAHQVSAGKARAG